MKDNYQKTERIALATPDFGPKSVPAQLVIKWFRRAANIRWSCGIPATHSAYFAFAQFLDTDSVWSDKIIRRLHGDIFPWERGRPFINLPAQELKCVLLPTATWIAQSLPEVYASASLRFAGFAQKYMDSEAEPEPEPEREVRAVSRSSAAARSRMENRRAGRPRAEKQEAPSISTPTPVAKTKFRLFEAGSD